MRMNIDTSVDHKPVRYTLSPAAATYNRYPAHF
jgi:hypothetical protein